MERKHFDQARVAKTNFSKQVDDIRADTYLTKDGRKAMIARLYTRYKSDVAALREQHRAARQSYQLDLERRLFGNSEASTGFDTISYRDAMDRVDQLGRGDQKDAMRLLARAEMTNDEPMRKAVLMRAFRDGWDEVVSQEVDKRPELRESLTQLESVILEASGAQGKFEESVLFGMQKPEEIRGMSDQALELAAEEPAPEQTKTRQWVSF